MIYSIMFYIIITAIVVSATAYGVWRRYHREDEMDEIGLLDPSSDRSSTEGINICDEEENNAVL